LSVEKGPQAIDVAANLTEVRRLAEWLRSQCDSGGIGPLAAVDLELAMVEAANNIVEHGYGGRAEQIRVEFIVGGGVAVLTLIDHGAPCPHDLYHECRDVPLDANRGRGAGILRSCVDVVNYATNGGENRLVLTKLL